MNPKLKLVRRKGLDEWDEFRPHVTRRSGLSPGSKLLIALLLSLVLLFGWIWFKPSISGTVAEIRSAISQMGQRRAAASKSRPAALRRPSARSEVPRARSSQDAARVPGPFEVYLLDGDRFIRVDSSSRSILLNTETGEATWMDSEGAARRR